MRLLIIICSHAFDAKWSDNIKILNDYIINSNIDVEYCGISNQNDFHNYEHIIQFKYKIVNTHYQLSKVCDFITDYKSELHYDWYMKIRPEIQLLEPIDFNLLSDNAINARARIYNGPSKIKYGMSINGEGPWKNLGDCHYAEKEHDIILDDMIYIFHNNIVQKNVFDKLENIHGCHHEWTHTAVFNKRNVNLNVIGIHLYFAKFKAFSGNTYSD